MTSEEDALAAVLVKCAALPARKVALLYSLGQFAAEDVLAQRPLPVFDNSAMDGYSVQAQSCRAGASLRVVGEQPAGADRGLTIGAGEAIRIFTGAPMPAGADAVIMQEEVTRAGNAIVLQGGAESGEFIRRQGCDIAEGQKILSRGEPVLAPTLALLASQGIAEIKIGGTPRVAIVSTGDELIQPGATPQPGQIFESNSIMLHALALRAGAEITLVEHSADDLERMTEMLRRGLRNDALIVSGGVSVGERDFVRPVLKTRSLAGCDQAWETIPLRPRGPLLHLWIARESSLGLCDVSEVRSSGPHENAWRGRKPMGIAHSAGATCDRSDE